jgi:Cytochrome P460/Haem-binding domain
MPGARSIIFERGSHRQWGGGETSPVQRLALCNVWSPSGVKAVMAQEPSSRLRALVWSGSAIAMLFLALQLVRPDLPNPPVGAEVRVPAEVKQVLESSCYNCHSNETKLSWFDWPVPAVWLVAKDVKDARARLNFSEIGRLPIEQQRAALFECVSQIELGAMPLPQYQRLHPESAITADKLRVLKDYLNAVAQSEGASAIQAKAADAQYETWIQAGSSGASALQVAASPNGIAFLPDYKNWRAISSSERDDNATLRQILGNEIAVKAVADGRIHPWPDGAAFAKIAWFQRADENSVLRPGAFFQVEFMIRDSKKYAKTLGWGWARWRGTDLKPYGKDKDFANECVGCHRPLASTDYVFTRPIRGAQ